MNLRSVTTSVTVKEAHSDVRTYTLRMQMYCVTRLPARYAQSFGIWKLKSNNTKGAVKHNRPKVSICRFFMQKRALVGVFRPELMIVIGKLSPVLSGCCITFWCGNEMCIVRLLRGSLLTATVLLEGLSSFRRGLCEKIWA